MERQFLIDDFKLSESWRLFKILGEFVDGIENLHDLGPAVSIFGSARTQPKDPQYKKAETIAALFVKNGFVSNLVDPHGNSYWAYLRGRRF